METTLTESEANTQKLGLILDVWGGIPSYAQIVRPRSDLEHAWQLDLLEAIIERLEQDSVRRLPEGAVGTLLEGTTESRGPLVGSGLWYLLGEVNRLTRDWEGDGGRALRSVSRETLEELLRDFKVLPQTLVDAGVVSLTVVGAVLQGRLVIGPSLSKRLMAYFGVGPFGIFERYSHLKTV